MRYMQYYDKIGRNCQLQPAKRLMQETRRYILNFERLVCISGRQGGAWRGQKTGSILAKYDLRQRKRLKNQYQTEYCGNSEKTITILILFWNA